MVDGPLYRPSADLADGPEAIYLPGVKRNAAPFVLACIGILWMEPLEAAAPPATLVLKGYATPVGSDGCGVDVQMPAVTQEITLDTLQAFSLRLALVVENPMSVAVVAWAFDIRWECDSSALAPDPGPIVIPAYSETVPFCVDLRSNAPTKDFTGFDVVAAGGPTLLPESTGIVRVEAVPFELGEAIDSTFRIASLVDQCCAGAGSSCSGGGAVDPACMTLVALHGTDAFAPALSIVSALPLRPFARFDGNYWDGLLAGDMMSLPDTGARYPLQMVGMLEARTEDGSTVTSNVLRLTVSVCRGCGQRTGMARMPFGVSRCFH
jgi:hypothetical protein